MNNKPIKLKLSLPLPPSVNHCYGLTIAKSKSGKLIPIKYMTPIAKAYKQEIGYRAIVEMNKLRIKRIGKEKFIMEIKVWWKDKRNGDCDNLLKLLQDGLKGLIFEDDDYCLPRFIDFNYDKLNPRLEVAIYTQEYSEKSEMEFEVMK